MTPIPAFGWHDQDPSTPGSAAQLEKMHAAGGAYADGVMDSRGVEAGDLLQFDGASFVRLPRGAPGERLIVRSDGTLGWEKPAETSVEAFGAVTTGDATKAFQEASEYIKNRGGGTVKISDLEYMVDGLLLESGVLWQGARRGTVLKAKEGSANQGMVMIPKGVIELGGMDSIIFKPNSKNTEQDVFCLYAQELSPGNYGGLDRYTFSNLHVGTALSPCPRYGMWFRAGHTIGSPLAPHQFIDFKNVTIYRQTTGAQGLTSRGLKCTGQCAKFGFDESFQINGYPSGTLAGTNMELGREFLKSSTLTAGATKGETKITVASTTGLEANKIFSVGEGEFDEVCEVLSIAGLVVTVKAALKFSHLTGDTVKLLSGTVAAPATAAPIEFSFEGGAIQNADLQVLVDAGDIINFHGTDFENQAKVLRVRKEARDVKIYDGNFTECSEGEGNGQGTVTAGSAVITGATKSWTVGDHIASVNGGIPAGATVKEVAGSTITISAPVEANGVEGAISVTLIKGGNGEGYIANFEGKSTGHVGGRVTGASDNYVILTNNEGGAVGMAIEPTNPVKTKMSAGGTLAIPTAETLTVNGAREVVLTDAAKSIKTINALHNTGEVFYMRAEVNGTKIIKGGNVLLPAGVATLELLAGEFVTVLRTDRGPCAFVVSRGI